MDKKWKDRLKLLGAMLVFLMWIPLGVLAFATSPVRTDIKLGIGAGASFLAMMIWMIKEN